MLMNMTDYNFRATHSLINSVQLPLKAVIVRCNGVV